MNLDFLWYMVYAVIGFFIAEVLIYSVSLLVKRRFHWLILHKDEKPELSKTGLKTFLSHGYDSELGWIRKPNTSHNEKGKYGITKWTTNIRGARTNPGFETKNSEISCYGDSFGFCRQVNDDETWEHYLSILKNTNITNFSVGNYGIDQALLRIKREFKKNKTNTVILAIVPDTISRIISIWKHYYEYGNTFGFKPRFTIKNNELLLIKNPIDNESKFNDYQSYLSIIQKNDFFYKNKFKKEILNFPYCFTILKNFHRNFSIIYWVIKIQYLKKFNKNWADIEWNPKRIIMRINLQWRIKLYQNKEVLQLFRKIVEEFVLFSKENEFRPVLAFLPQKDDVNFIKDNFHFYENFLNELDSMKELLVIDAVNDLVKEHDIDAFYSDNNEYGGHFSREGNNKIATIISNELVRNSL